MQITTSYYTLTPAYGRDYKSAKAVKEDFLAGKDFLIQPQDKPISIRDFAEGVKVNIRYKKLTQVTVIKVPAKVEN